MDIKELKEKMAEALEKAKAAEGMDEKTALLDEFDALSEQLKAAERVDAAEKAFVAEKFVEKQEEAKKEDEAMDAVKDFARAARARFKTVSILNEGTSADGGYTVPEDIRTNIEKLRDARFSLRELVRVESVTTLSGERTFMKRSSQAGFSSVAEGGKIPAKGVPQFGRYAYSCVKYGGYYPITSELLEDSDANIVAVLTEWIANDERITDNGIILATLDEKYERETSPETADEIEGIDDIKYILNVKLGQAFKPTSVIVTNDSGLQWLDTLKDEEGRYLLSASPADPMAFVLAAGATTVPVRVVPNADLPDDETYGTPFYIGDLKEAIVLWDRKSLSIKMSDVAVVGSGNDALNAFEEDLSIARALVRLDCSCRDDKAYYKGFYLAQ